MELHFSCLFDRKQELTRVQWENARYGIQLLRGISKSFGLEECYIEKKMKLESSYNILGPSYYPALSNFSVPKNYIGQFPHHDPSLLVLVAQNVGRGVQILLLLVPFLSLKRKQTWSLTFDSNVLEIIY